MRPTIVLLLVFVLNLRAQDDYKPGPDSIAQASVPKGELLKGTYSAKEGSVFPGTERGYDIYLPAGYDKAKPAPFMVFQDGVIYNAPVVFDNLIAKKQIPPLIGIFIKPGVVPAANPNALPRYNRSYEYDSVSDTYARFLIDELLPAIEAKHGLKLSTDPNDAAICGNSSGGICAFITAWHRPERFRRVFSGVGTYVGIHGADQLPVLVRKMEPRPLRIYLQSGEQDNNLYCGDWWMANQTMERALTWAGYDVAHTWGTGGHNAKHATAIFPDVLRWLWRDHATAKEIKANPRGESKWVGYSVIGEESKWRELLVPDNDPDVGNLPAERPPYVEDRMGLAADSSGSVWASQAPYFQIIKSGLYGTFDVVEKKIMQLRAGIACGKAEGIYYLEDSGKGPFLDSTNVKTWKPDEKPNLFASSLANATGICFSNSGKCYVASGYAGYPGIQCFDAAGKNLNQVILDKNSIWSWTRMALSPDQTQIYISNFSGHSVWTYKILENGEMVDGQAFYRLDE